MSSYEIERDARQTFVNTADPLPIAQSLFTRGVLTQEQIDRISSSPTKRSRSGKLWDTVAAQGSTALRELMVVSSELNFQQIVQSIERLVVQKEKTDAFPTKANEPSVTLKEGHMGRSAFASPDHPTASRTSNSPPPASETSGESMHGKVIRQNLFSLCHNIDLKNSDFLQLLVQKEVLTYQERQYVEGSSLAESKQVDVLLQLLTRKSSLTFNKFKAALRQTGQGHIVDQYLQQGMEDADKSDDLSRWRHSLAGQYHRMLAKFPIYAVTDDPALGDLRRIYTRTTLQDVQGFPPLPQGESYEEYGNIFTGDTSVRRALLLGSAGSGKSILARRLALNWADLILPTDKPTSQDWRPTDGEQQLLQQINILVFIDLSMIRSHCTLSSVLLQQLVLANDYDYSLCYDYIKCNQEHVLFVLDAWDEFTPEFCPELADLANGRKLPDVVTFITSRIREQTNLPQNIDQTVKTSGFSEVQARRFIHSMNEAFEHSKNKDVIPDFLTKKKLWELFCLPFLTSYLCIIYADNKALPETVTDLFVSIISYKINHEIIKHEKKQKHTNQPLSKFRDQILALGKIALDGLLQTNTQTVFDKDKVLASIGDKAFNLGLLQQTKSDKAMRQSQVTFSHKSLQEFIAAVYVVHKTEGYSLLNEHLKSLVEIYDLQLFIIFVCGLDGTLGRDLIGLIKKLTATSTATVAQCPGFSMYAWSYEGTEDQELIVHEIAKETMPFLLEICHEMSSVSNIDSFPSKNKSNNKEKPPVSCRPQINLNVISLFKVVTLIRHHAIVFSPDPNLYLYHVHADNDNVHTVESLLGNIDLSETVLVSINYTKSVTSKPIITSVITKIKKLKYFYMRYSEVPPSDMQGIMQHLAASLTQTLMVLWLEFTALQGCEATLCHVVSQLLALRELYLCDQALAGHEQQLCDAVSHLHQLLWLDLSRTNMSAAGGALPGCLASLPQLRWLTLYGCKLGSEQVSQVCQVVGTICTQLLLIYLGVNKLHGTSLHSLTCLGKLNKVQYMTLPACDLSASQEMRSVFSSLPASVLYLYMADCTISDDVTCITALIPTKPNLRYLRIDGSPISEPVVLDLREACQQAGVVLITTREKWRQHYAGIYAILDQINKDIQALY